jgi:hypothetical protein
MNSTCYSAPFEANRGSKLQQLVARELVGTRRELVAGRGESEKAIEVTTAASAIDSVELVLLYNALPVLGSPCCVRGQARGRSTRPCRLMRAGGRLFFLWVALAAHLLGLLIQLLVRQHTSYNSNIHHRYTRKCLQARNAPRQKQECTPLRRGGKQTRVKEEIGIKGFSRRRRRRHSSKSFLNLIRRAKEAAAALPLVTTEETCWIGAETKRCRFRLQRHPDLLLNPPAASSNPLLTPPPPSSAQTRRPS